MIGWKEVSSAGLGLIVSGGLWIGAETIESKELHAAQKVEDAQQRKELDTNGERITAVERAVISFEALSREMSELNKKLIGLQEEKSKSKRK